MVLKTTVVKFQIKHHQLFLYCVRHDYKIGRMITICKSSPYLIVII